MSFFPRIGLSPTSEKLIRFLGAMPRSFFVIPALILSNSAAAESVAAFNVLEVNEDGTEYSLTLQLLLLMTVLAVLPSILILMTSFTRIIIVLSLLRQALGTAKDTRDVLFRINQASSKKEKIRAINTTSA